MVKLPPGKNSTKGVGRTAPDPSKTYTTDDGVAIPLGEGKELLDSYSALLYNEYPYCCCLSLYSYENILVT